MLVLDEDNLLIFLSWRRFCHLMRLNENFTTVSFFGRNVGMGVILCG